MVLVFRRPWPLSAGHPLKGVLAVYEVHLKARKLELTGGLGTRPPSAAMRGLVRFVG